MRDSNAPSKHPPKNKKTVPKLRSAKLQSRPTRRDDPACAPRTAEEGVHKSDRQLPRAQTTTCPARLHSMWQTCWAQTSAQHNEMITPATQMLGPIHPLESTMKQGIASKSAQWGVATSGSHVSLCEHSPGDGVAAAAADDDPVADDDEKLTHKSLVAPPKQARAVAHTAERNGCAGRHGPGRGSCIMTRGEAKVKRHNACCRSVRGTRLAANPG